MKDNEGSSRANNPNEFLPFMDAFYSLSSNKPDERSFAANSILNHVFMSENSATNIDAIVQDGDYALTRLFLGLCSGRASARQGYASCLATFIKLAFQRSPDTNDTICTCWMERFLDYAKKNSKVSSDINTSQYLRNQLLFHTSMSSSSSTQKNNKGARGQEDRDYKFGRLFGILAIARSGSLSIGTNDNEVVKGYINDILDLYNHKKWMREPAAHALQEFFSCLPIGCNATSFESIIDDKFASFLKFDDVHTWTAEKIPIYLHLQTLFADVGIDPLPKLLRKPLLTNESLKNSASNEENMIIALRNTSSVVHPRCHVVWKTIWSYLAQNNKETSKGLSNRYPLRNNLPSGNDSAEVIIKALIDELLVGSLLGGTQHDSNNEGNATYERRALAMTLLQQICKLELPVSLLENTALQPTIVTKLFLNTLRTCSGGDKNHTLKPLAQKILEGVMESTDIDFNRRIGFVKAFLRVNSNFDAITKTDTVSKLLGLDYSNDQMEISKELIMLWESYISFLETKIINESKTVSSEATKYIDLLFSFSKRIIRSCKSDVREKLVNRVLLFFMIGAFFDLSKFKKKSLKIDGCSKEIIERVASLYDVTEDTPHSIQFGMSSRFHSLLSDAVLVLPHSQVDVHDGGVRDLKLQMMTKQLEFVRSSLNGLLSAGATYIHQPEDENMRKKFSESVKIVNSMSKLLSEETTDEHDPKRRTMCSISCLISSLFFQLLHPGKEALDEMRYDEDDDDDSDGIDEEIHDAIRDLSDNTAGIIGIPSLITDDEGSEDEDDTTPLASFAGTCVNILSSSIAGNSFENKNSCRSGGSKLIRDCVKSAWISTLSFGSSSGGAILVDKDVMSILVESACGQSIDIENTEEDSEEDVGSDIVDDESMDAEDAVNAAMDVSDDDNSESENKRQQADEESDDDEDIELPSSTLENLLLEDSDADMESDDDGNILEHHAGADGALAQLIKMKQEARKAGQNRKEKIALTSQLHTMILLESLLNPSFIRSSFLTNELVLSIIIPMLQVRRKLEKSLSSDRQTKADKSFSSEKNAVIDRLTSILKEKVCKCITVPSGESKDKEELISKVSSQVYDELKGSISPIHRSCCSCLLISFIRAVSDNTDHSVKLARSIYVDAVYEWSTKKSTKLSESLFEDLINRNLRIAQTVLTEPFVEACANSRSSYLKAEAYRMIASLYVVPKEASNKTEEEGEEDLSITLLKSCTPKLMEEISRNVPQDEELCKAKRIRHVLKAVDKVVTYHENEKDRTIRNSIHGLVDSLTVIKEKSTSAIVISQCEKLIKDIQTMNEKLTVVEVETTSSSPEKKSSSSSKNKKGKKSKKKKK